MYQSYSLPSLYLVARTDPARDLAGYHSSYLYHDHPSGSPVDDQTLSLVLLRSPKQRGGKSAGNFLCLGYLTSHWAAVYVDIVER